MHRLRLALLALLLALSVGSASAAPSRQVGRTIATFFSATQNWIAPPFYDFWSGNGGLPIFGYPLAPTDLMTSPDDGKVYATQIFERNRLEYHPENPEPYQVQLGRLGVEVLQKQGRNWQDFPKGEPKRGCDFFPETGHTLCEPFRSYWRRYGLDLGMRGVARAESIALFGLPISEPMMETNADGATVLTQWFERARFEYHPNNPPQYRVLLGLLGKELYGPYRPGATSVSGTVEVMLRNKESIEVGKDEGPFWETVNRSGSGMKVSRASLWIRGPFYPPDHPLSGVADDWFGVSAEIKPDNTGAVVSLEKSSIFKSFLAEIKPDNTFAFPEFVPEAPGGTMEIWHGEVEGTCDD
ncbi:MAG: hypothetical protein ACUVSY_01360, partial [Roseiflexus sp.]